MAVRRLRAPHSAPGETLLRHAGLALIAAITLFAGGLAVTWLAGEELTAPASRNVGPPPASLPGSRPVVFQSGSGSIIAAWYAPGNPRQGTVVLAHPVRADRRSMLSRAEFLQRAGYAVLLYDAQAHGESPGDRISFGFLEARDAAAAVAFAAEQDPGAPVAFIGVSLGGAAALLGEKPLPVSALVLEAVYPTIREAIANRLSLRLGEPGRFLVPFLLWQLPMRHGISEADLEPRRGIKAAAAPVLLLAGEKDERTTLSQSQALFDAAPEPKAIWVIPGASHRDFHGFAGPAYEKKVLAFLADALQPAESSPPPR